MQGKKLQILDMTGSQYIWSFMANHKPGYSVKVWKVEMSKSGSEMINLIC